jgi:hypothetical protein
MKSLNKTIIVIFAALSFMPQSVFSMEQAFLAQPNITYVSENVRYVNGQLQHRQPRVTRHEDGTKTINYDWVNVQRSLTPSGAYKHISYHWDCPQ